MERSTINRVLAVSGGLTVLSGLFLLFHYDSTFTKAAHELGALILAVFCGLHLKVNWKAFCGSLGGRRFGYLLLVLLTGSALVMAVTGERLDEEALLRQLQERLNNR